MARGAWNVMGAGTGRWTGGWGGDGGFVERGSVVSHCGSHCGWLVSRARQSGQSR